MEPQLFILVCAACLLAGALLLSIASRAAKVSLQEKERRRGLALKRQLRIKAIEDAIATQGAKMKIVENKLNEALAELQKSLKKIKR